MGKKYLFGILLTGMLLAFPSYAQTVAKRKAATAEWLKTQEPLTQDAVRAAKAAKAKAAKSKRPLKTPESTGEVVDEHGIIQQPAEGVEKTYVRTGPCYMSQSQQVKQTEQSGTITIVECSDGTIYIKDIIAYNPCETWVKGTKEGNTITIPTMQPLIYIGSRGANATIRWGMKTPSGSFMPKADQSEPFTFTIEGNSIVQQNTSANFFMGQFYDDDNSFTRYGIYQTVWNEFVIPTEIDDLPYTPSFTDLMDQESFTIINVNNDGGYWKFNTNGYAEYKYDWDNPGDDWLITPGIKLEKGKAYRFAIETWASYDDERLEVKMGTDKTAEAMTTEVVPSTDITWRDDDKRILENKFITVNEDGYYYFGLHAISDPNKYRLHVNNLVVEVSADLNAPATVEDLTVVSSTSKLAATISFKAPTKTAKGEALTGNLTQIDILRNDEVIKTFEDVAPGSELSYVDDDETLTIGSYSYKVIAYNANGKGLTSDAVEVFISNVAEVPYVADFSTREGFDACQVVDANGDSYTWKWAEGGNYAYYEHNSNNAGDDYLVSQPIHLERGKHYVVTANVNAFDEERPERFEVVLGRKAEAGSLTMKLIEPTEITSVFAADYSATFTVPVEGNYYIAIHGISDKGMYFLVAHSLSVTKGVEPTAPAAVENLTATAGAQAALEVNIAFTAPTKTANGEELSDNMNVEIYRDNILVKTLENVAPGSNQTWKDENVGNGKTYTYQLVPTNADGSGEKSEKVEVYVGYDVPAYVENVAAKDQFSNIHFSWNAVGTTGPNGGYVDPAQVTYMAWTIGYEDFMGIQIPVFDQLLGEVTAANNMDATFNTLEGEQGYKPFAIQPTNITGAGQETYASVLVGKPYELPFVESFTDNSLHYFWEAENAALLTSDDASDGDGSAVEILAKKMGGVYFESGKISIKDIVNPTLLFDAKGNGVRALTVYVAKDGGDYELLETAQLTGTYNTFQMPLGSVQDAEQYIRFKFKGMYMTPYELDASGNLVSKGNYVTLDAIRVSDLYEHDLEVALDAPATLTVGNDAKVKVTIKNNATNAASDFTVKLTAGNKELLNKTVTEELQGFASIELEAVYATTVFDEAGDIALQAEVSYEDDLNDENNTLVATLTLKDPAVTAPTNLVAEQAGDNAVKLTWDTPSSVAVAPMTEDFENGLNGFTTVDSDGDGYDWTHHENEETGKYKVTSGICSVFSESFSNDGTGALTPDNWLITPKAKLDGEFSFWACGQDKNYPAETFGIYVSTGESTDVNNFVPVSPMYTTTADMTKYTVDLSAFEGQTGYVAIRHYNVTDQFCLVVDDVTYTPANLTPESYNIYVDAALTDNTVETAAELKELTAGNHVFAVTAVFPNGMESKPVTASLEVTTAINEILNSGKSFTIYSVDGKLINRQATNLNGLKGVYIINNKTVVVK
jgi:hypothetical protein